MAKVRVGFIGAGGNAQWHGRQMAEQTEDVEIVALADPNQSSREAFATKLNLPDIPQFASHAEMLAQVELDAVVISTPHTLHYEQAADAMNAGAHVLVEKPMTCTSREAEQLLATAKERNKILQVSYQRHFQPEFLYIKQAIARGEIGKLTSITASLYQEWKQLSTNTWRQDPALSGGGFMMDSGSHIIDILLWTTGLTPAEVKPVMHRQGTAVEIDSFTSIRFEEGAVAGLNLVGFAPCWHETYVFCGEEGGIFFENGKITVRRSNAEPVVPQLENPATNSDKSFIDAVLGRNEVQVSGEYAYKVIKLTEMIYQAAGYNPA